MGPHICDDSCTSASLTCPFWVEQRQSRAERKAAYDADVKRRAEALANAPTQGALHAHMRKYGVPERNLEPLRSLRGNAAITAARAWWRRVGEGGRQRGLVLAGRTGVGKSTAAAWCVEAFSAAYPWNQQPGGVTREPIVWLEGGKLAQLSEWSEKGSDELERARSCHLLVLNDAGVESTKPSLAALANLIMLRLDSSRLLILTSSMIGTAFVNRYGVAVADRLRADAECPNLGKEKSQRQPRRDQPQ